MAAKTQGKAPSAPTFMDPAMMPWVLVSELYWMSYKLQERRFYHLGVSAFPDHAVVSRRSAVIIPRAIPFEMPAPLHNSSNCLAFGISRRTLSLS